MQNAKAISLQHIVKHNKGAVIGNFLLLVVEIALMALVPLFIGMAIDDLIAQQTQGFWVLLSLLFSLVLVSVFRRLYDTRAYGGIRVKVQTEVLRRHRGLATSIVNARLQMARELVDFLEQDVAQAINAVVQFFVSLLVLYYLNPVLSLSALLAATAMIVIYCFFHRRFYSLNKAYNSLSERQVSLVNKAIESRLKTYFTRLMRLEVRLSDTEAVLYELVFLGLLAMVSFNLWFATATGTVSAGQIFSIVSYSWEFVEASVVLPMTLQSLTRLAEITDRINLEPGD